MEGRTTNTRCLMNLFNEFSSYFTPLFQVSQTKIGDFGLDFQTPIHRTYLAALAMVPTAGTWITRVRIEAVAS